MATKFVSLLTSAHVNGVLRHPHEGALHLEQVEADRLIEAKAATDVTADFTAAQKKGAPVERLTTDDGKLAAALSSTPHPHLAEGPDAPAAEAPTAEIKPAAE